MRGVCLHDRAPVLDARDQRLEVDGDPFEPAEVVIADESQARSGSERDARGGQDV